MRRAISLTGDWLLHVVLAALFAVGFLIVAFLLLNFVTWEWRFPIDWKVIRIGQAIGLVWGSVVFAKALRDGEL